MDGKKDKNPDNIEKKINKIKQDNTKFLFLKIAKLTTDLPSNPRQIKKLYASW